jgi:hypothetical protein
LRYCPDVGITRGEMAPMLLKARYGSTFNPGTASGTLFYDVPRTHVFAAWIERLFNYQVTLGCSANPRLYCPDATVTRAQMAMFIARAMAGGDSAVPASGTGYNCTTGGASLYTDVAPTASYCRHVHYIAASSVTQGCTATAFCPTTTVSRAQMAMFIARAMRGGDGNVPAMGTIPGVGDYSCMGAPGSLFADVATTAAYCRHTHYLWARRVIDGCTLTAYCPAPMVIRGQMAKFLTNGFGLTLYSPVP